MADKRLYMQYRYKVEMTYLNIKNNTNTPIKNECVKMVVIDHNYDDNTMPIVYVTLNLDRALVDDMIINANDNLFLLAIYKYDNLTDSKQEIEVFRDKFTYFLPDDVNKYDSADYNDSNEKEHLGNTYRELALGLMSIKMINRNKRLIELNTTNSTIMDCVNYCLSEFDNVLIEPFAFNEVHERIIVPPQESVNKALQFLNSLRVFYFTPYRFYQDFKYTYLISSSGIEIPKYDEVYSTVLIDVKDINDRTANDIGVVANKSSGTYEIPINYVHTNVYDNTIMNKSKNKIKAFSSTSNTTKTLINNASYSTDKTKVIRLNNDNDNMIYNIEANDNSSNIFIYFNKNDLDMDVLTINKRITVNHIDRYKEHNGSYLMSRKRECLLREDRTFILISMINLNKIEQSTDVLVTPFSIN